MSAPEAAVLGQRGDALAALLMQPQAALAERDMPVIKQWSAAYSFISQMLHVQACFDWLVRGRWITCRACVAASAPRQSGTAHSRRLLQDDLPTAAASDDSAVAFRSGAGGLTSCCRVRRAAADCAVKTDANASVCACCAGGAGAAGTCKARLLLLG